MPIMQGDIKLLKSERMTDNEDGGGRITGQEIQDGLSNEIFDDVSDLDRVYGRTSLRKAFAAVETDDTDQYFGSHIIVDEAPDDDNVSVLLFSTGSATDLRATAREQVEGYVLPGPLTRMRLYGDQLPGQRTVLAYQLPGYTLPDIGDVLLLRTEEGADEGEFQYVRVTEVESETSDFVDGQGTFRREVVEIGISTPLNRRFYGHEVVRNTATQPASRLRYTNVADAARYFGVSRLAVAASLGSREFQVDTIYQPIVPSTQGETPVVDVPVGGGVSVKVESGGITHEIQQVAETDEIVVQINNRNFNYTRNLSPRPAPGTLVVEYRALGRWYTLRDEEGNGELSGSGTGQVNYATGSVIVTLQALPDADSSILFSWGTPIHYTDRAGSVEIERPGMLFELDHGAVTPGSIEIRWISGGETKLATDDGFGNITGDAIGAVAYGWMNLPDMRPGRVYVDFNAPFPDANSTVELTYDWGGGETNIFHPVVDGAGFVTLQLPNAPIKPGSIEVSFKIQNYTERHERQFTRWGRQERELTLLDEKTIEITLFDNAQGGFRKWEGFIDYETGMIYFEVEKNREHLIYEPSVPDNNAHGVTWVESINRDTFIPDSSVLVRSTPNMVQPTTTTVIQDLQPMVVELLPLLQDRIVPGTLRFTFRGSTYVDRDGSLYRDVDPNTGAGFLAGRVVYRDSLVEITDWAAGGSSLINIHSLVSTFGAPTITQARFRTPGSPVQVGGLTLLATTLDGEQLNAQANFQGEVVGTSVEGRIDYTTGICRTQFGEYVADDSLTNEERNEYWYDPSLVENGLIWRPRQVLPSAVRFNAVILVNLPLDAELLGLDPVRLPPDGRVPIFREAQVAVVHHTQRTPWPMGTAPGDSLDVGRTRLALLHVEDANGTRLPAEDASADLDAGIITLDAGADLSALVEPLYAVHRIEDMVLLSDVQIGGQLRIIGQLSHDYPADETLVSSALIAGDLQARWANLFDQSTWTNVWSDARIGNPVTATYNATVYPLEVTNRGTITERWAMIFTTSTNYRVVGESVGEIMTGNTAEDLAPLNPNTGVPYFELQAAGWGSGWSSGNVVRFNTVGANHPIWLARTVLQGPAQGSDFQFRLQVRGNVNAEPANT